MKIADERKTAAASFLQARIDKNRITLPALGMVRNGRQTPLAEQHLFILQKANSHFLLPATEAGTAYIPSSLHGGYLFVILATDPFTVYCSPAEETRCLNGARVTGYVAGHTSLSERKKVLYAGEIYFNNGILSSWNNSSGHYTPPDALMSINILPPVARILPPNLFVSRANRPAHGGDPVTGMCAARGYVAMPIKGDW